MSIKVYFKKGKVNYKEQKLINKLSSAITKKIEENPEFAKEFQPARDYNELQNLVYKYCVDDVPFEELPKESMKTENETPKNEPKSFFDDDDDTFVDPMNREEPIVRDYVMNNEFESGSSSSSSSNIQSDFGEPMTFEESFSLPSEDDIQQGNANNSQGAGRQNRGVQKQAPINPDFDDMSNSRKRKSTKKFAKYIVSAVAMLQERGFIWYATKDINEAKLMEYELAEEMDLSLLLSLEGGQEITIKDFFKSQCLVANELAKIDKDKLDDLTDVLAEVMMEKGVAPTPQQELLLIGGSILAEQVLKMIAFNTQVKGVLNQLRSMKASSIPNTEPARPTPPPQPAPQPKQEEPITYPQQEIKEQVYNEPPQQSAEGDFDELESMIINNPLETIE